ncbi:MAG: hypothetical protein E6K77_02750 [Candidatus Eisenbacteria bacterium]|uniref:Uncharacterized protein n=1 Tax=Eiseniibacteriota bacterium TaxID=2212470 RepID=A0A538TPD4_UNCEI|nr:MAG: hypothetical protein E6K74_00740 [Candidatus Eisenbacteria bacterium]TMQ65497.1 MAG: hypothetical protein E6K77_02750 [Candidatus Eisenbacteria bacterium]
MPHIPGIETWIAALLTLACMSFLYKDNPFFRFAESLFAGISLGYFIGITLNQTLVPNLILPLHRDFGQNWDLLVPGLLGVLLYMRYVPKIGWISRFALSIYVAYYIGLDFTRRIHGEVLPQLARAIVPLSKFDSHTILYSLIFSVGVFSVLIYFFFSKEQDAVTRRVARLGIWFLMISFGAAFGFTVMGRVALLIGRLNFLILDWIYPMIGLR